MDKKKRPMSAFPTKNSKSASYDKSGFQIDENYMSRNRILTEITNITNSNMKLLPNQNGQSKTSLGVKNAILKEND